MAYTDPARQREYQREWKARRRSEWVEAHGPCVRCGGTDDLNLHHRDPAQKIDHKVWSWSRPRREAELAKCEVLCGACHREHHAQPLRSHGLTAYQRRRCRCDTCRAAKAVSDRRRRQRNRAMK